MTDYFQSFVFTLLHDHQVTHIKYHSAIIVTLVGISLSTSFPLSLQHVILYFQIVRLCRLYKLCTLSEFNSLKLQSSFVNLMHMYN